MDGGVRIEPEVIQQLADHAPIIFSHQSSERGPGAEAKSQICFGGQVEVRKIAKLAKIAGKLLGQVSYGMGVACESGSNVQHPAKALVSHCVLIKSISHGKRNGVRREVKIKK